MRALATKYRPKTFNDVTEQDNIITILSNQLATKDFKNCYLFTGGAGTGKTTNARIFAMEINEGKGTPIEIDAASNNGVDNVREIIEDAKFKSLDAPFKIYIMDECHMLSTGAWNAMLKLLEEPPAGTIFIFCTTDPQKIPATIMSRVQRYDFQRISYQGIVDRLNYVLECEGITDYEEEAVHFIAQQADGGMRDALTMLDKCLSLSSELTVDTVLKSIGFSHYEDLIEVMFGLIERNPNNVILTINNVFADGGDLKQFSNQLLLLTLDICKFIQLTDSGVDELQALTYTKIPQQYLVPIKDLIKLSEYEVFIDHLKALKELNSELRFAHNIKAVVEAHLLLEACL